MFTFNDKFFEYMESQNLTEDETISLDTQQIAFINECVTNYDARGYSYELQKSVKHLFHNLGNIKPDTVEDVAINIRHILRKGIKDEKR